MGARLNTAEGHEQSASAGRTADRIEFVATILMAVAAILTAWAAFQSTKWSGVQADNYSQASAARTESSRATTIASRQIIIDVEMFLQWVDAYQSERAVGTNPNPAATAKLAPRTLSEFIAARFRDEFRPAFDAWIASNPLVNEQAANTPFELPEYGLAQEEESALQEATAQERTTAARDANQQGDNYVLLTVLFAVSLFFAGVSGKLNQVTNSAIALGVSILVAGGALILMATYPIQF